MNLKINVISPMLKPNNIEFNSKSIILSNNIEDIQRKFRILMMRIKVKT